MSTGTYGKWVIGCALSEVYNRITGSESRVNGRKDPKLAYSELGATTGPEVGGQRQVIDPSVVTVGEALRNRICGQG